MTTCENRSQSRRASGFTVLPVIAQGLQNRPGVIVARSPRIEAASIYLSLDDGLPGTRFEVGDVIRLSAFA